MTARMYYDNDADPDALKGQTIAVIGYGSQGHAHALNLHESGHEVVVGLVRMFGIKELVRTGAVVMARGSASIEEALKK